MSAIIIRKMLLTLVILSGVFMLATSASAATADISYNGSDLGDGWRQYDYLLTNTSNATNDYIYGMRVNFDSSVEFVGLSLPENWNDIAGSPNTSFAMIYSPALGDDIAPTQTADVSFKIKNYSSPMDYTIFFDNHEGQRTTLVGTTVPVVPEPVSSTLFIIGGAALGVRTYLKRKK